MEAKNTFGEALKALRKSQGFTQEDLAQKLQIAKANISRYESGKQKPEFKHLVSIAAHLNVAPSTLLGEPSGIAALPQAQAFLAQMARNAKNKSKVKPTIPQLLEFLADYLHELPRSELKEVSPLMAAFVLAPDSAELKADLSLALAGPPPTETSDFAGLPPRGAIKRRTPATTKNSESVE
jgi:transcriptional regulator with XRE-family HTH domain